VTKELNVAKRAVVTKLDQIIAEFGNVASTITNVRGAIDRMLSEDS
jgi:hypothetical protein